MNTAYSARQFVILSAQSDTMQCFAQSKNLILGQGKILRTAADPCVPHLED